MRTADMTKLFPIIAYALLLISLPGFAAEEPKIIEHNRLMDHGDGHLMDMEGGMIMGQNKDKLPAGCSRISEDVQITVHGGRKYSKKLPGTMFAFDKQEWRVKPCSRLTITFINEDNVRHQWMMHGLPKFMYDKGMFHLEITGPAKITGTLILPAEDKTYLVHCDIAQHMEKGMKGELVVGKGSGTFPSIPGLTDPLIFDNYGPAQTAAAAPTAAQTAAAASQASGPSTAQPVDSGSSLLSGSLVLGLLFGFIGAPYVFKRCQGMTAAEILTSIGNWAADVYKAIAALISWLINRLSGKNKFLPKS